MNNIELTIDKAGNGIFFIREDDEQIAEMVFSVAGDRLTVYHTGVLPKGEGKGLAKQLLETMVSYARQHALKVVPLCPFVLAQFKRHPELYSDIWDKA